MQFLKVKCQHLGENLIPQSIQELYLPEPEPPYWFTSCSYQNFQKYSPRDSSRDSTKKYKNGIK